MNQWRLEKPKFSYAIEEGLYLSQAWWEEQGQRGLFAQHQGEKINPQIWMLNMKNRFGEDWREKPELEGDKLDEKVTININFEGEE